ncbi:uncharacterized protein N0V89_010322 [Didymosphaeria variabile]|uniref:SMP-30/Gluconolactonase/LRE-like region domain-containing protein n=1 Tax=Didymosphaeria variabile TaxID=1932322 RepID=A0A9W8XBJ4_9PLEO|nr:uncharacterized protein N0V89_010322 [Didymosphaeria variabile]KAJ4346393.1 hypothetical protein N0V89_010322 [Didymosphaeria variabile]
MDHWGDPWADDADVDTHTTIATPAEVATEPRPPPNAAHTPEFKPAPIVVNGFLDDAGWGSNAWATTPSPREDGDDGAFGGREAERKLSWGVHTAQEEKETIPVRDDDGGSNAWATAPGKEDASIDAGTNGVEHTADWDAPSPHDEYTRPDSLQHEVGNEWARIEEVVEESKVVENGVSETSESATTIQAEDTPARIESEEPMEVSREDDTSTRSSESHSEGSRNEAVTESPRTSVEEEQAAVKTVEAIHEDVEDSSDLGDPTEQQEVTVQEVEDDFGDFEDEVAQEAAETQLGVESTFGQPESFSKNIQDDMASDAQNPPTEAFATIPTGLVGNFTLDAKLLAELFPPVKDTPTLEEPPDDPVTSTSARKAWYRLTRKQTMREYNNGALDDNYIRVTWKTSQIRLEATKTVARWANEDRVAGRGPGARASFFWDTPHSPTDKRTSFASLHSRKTSTASVSKPVRPVSQTVPPLSTDVPAAFDWSSPSSATHAVPDNIGVRSTSSPITAKHNAIMKLQRQTGRAASVDLSSRRKEPSSHRRTSTATELRHNGALTAENRSNISPIQAPSRASLDPWAPTTTSSPVASIPAPVSDQINPWASLGQLDTGSAPKLSSTAQDEDDDDEWGEMVESPAVSTVQTPISTIAPTPIAELSEPPTRANTVSAPSTSLASAQPLPPQPLPPPTGPGHASAIVRLQGTVSPTSALFGPKALVPTDSEERIGPHLLKKRDRSREATPEKAKAVPVQMPTMDEVLSQPPPANKEFIEGNGETEFSATAMPAPLPESDTGAPIGEEDNLPIADSTPSLTPASAADQPNWGDDADFSIFESALPPSIPTTAPQSLADSDPADPLSIFDSPIPSEPSASFARSAPRPATPPTKQPLTSATSLAQRRKAEEDDVVRSIVDGLPDLGYMLLENTYLLPRPFNNTFRHPFVDANLSDPDITRTIDAARSSPFISYDEEFDEILGFSPQVLLVANSSEVFAFEAGVWVPHLNQVWFTAFLNPTPGYITILDLNTSKTFRPSLIGSGAPVLVNPNGGYYFDGLVYITSFGNATTAPTIVSIDPYTYETKEVINSFYELPLNGPDDITFAMSRTTGQPCMFYSDFYFAAEGLPGVWDAPQQLPNAVWKFSMADKSLQMAVSPLDVQTPNGLAVNRENTLLYVSDGPDSAVFGQPYNASSGSAGLYVFDLGGEDGCTPQNKRILGIARQGFANGIKIDDYGRIWTFEYEGVVVRKPNGKVLGVLNIHNILGRDSPDVAPGANFALVSDELYILGFYKVWKVKLGQVVKSWY